MTSTLLSSGSQTIRRCLRYTLAVALCLVAAEVAFAQDVETIPAESTVGLADNGQVFNPEYFEKFAPRTAADMVDQVPGFSLSTTDDKRGLGQGGINVLINGVRLSGKNNDAELALSRIPAASVQRIEVLSGASLDTPGLTGKVVDITTNENEFSGSWKYRAEWQKRARANLLGGEIAISGNSGAFEYNIGFSSTPTRQTETGPELVTDGSGTLIETRDELAFLFEDNPQISGELAFTPSNGHVGHLNVSYQRINLRQEDQSLQSAVTSAGVDGQRLNNFDIDSWNGEIGADYAFDVGPGNLKLIGIARYDDSDLSDIFREVAAGSDTTETFAQSTQTGETIVRAEYSVTEDASKDWQLAVEGAFNFLEAEAKLDGFDIDGGSSRVEERRAEASVTHNWKMSEKLSVQATAGVEYSELTQTGPTGLTRDFVRPKGFVSASYTSSDTLIVTGKVERSVGQLDFFDFVSSVDLANDIANAGNPQIVPPQSWDAEVEFEKDWQNGISGTLRVYGQQIEDAVDRIPLPNGGDAPGNIDSASVIGVELIGTVKLDEFGLKGAQLDVEFEARDSSIADPLTSVSRQFSAGLTNRYAIDFRHDIYGTDWAWGGRIENMSEAEEFRIDQISQFGIEQPKLELFVERKDVFGLTMRAEVKNLLESRTKFNRDLFSGDNRVNGAPFGAENRVREGERFYGFSVSGSF